MGDWYEVIKTIKGRPYRYRQRTWREGSHVRTQSHSLGPASAADVVRIRDIALRRRRGPSHLRVYAAIRLLTDPGQSDDRWVKPWRAAKQVNTTPTRFRDFDRITKALGVEIKHAGDRAAYSPTRDHILMPRRTWFVENPAFSASEAYYHTLAHELAHWTGHGSRLGRQMQGMSQFPTTEQMQAYAREELVAEATAVIVLTELGHAPQNLQQNATYFQHWLSRTGNEEAALEYVNCEAQRAAAFILGTVNTTK